jgi:multidrug efflux pump subunit AcrB
VTPADFASLVIGRAQDGYQVRLGDVARVEEGPENPYSGFRFNGEQAVGLGVIRQSGANTLEVVQALKREVGGDRARPAARGSRSTPAATARCSSSRRSRACGTRWPRPRCW